MGDVLFNTVYYGILLVGLLMGFISLIVAKPRIKFNFPEEELKIIEKRLKKGMVICFILMLFMPTTLIPLYIFSPRLILVIQFIILFFTISFTVSFFSYLLNFWLLRKKITENSSKT